jgi:unsaturated chondroitin disaccharide hydrolase
MIDIKNAPDLTTVAAKLPRVFESGLRATNLLRRAWSPEQGAPVYTRAGIYSTRGWTEWTQGFQFGNALYLFEATGDEAMLAYGRDGTLRHMASHVSHVGVHDHGFNNVSTYGNLLRLMHEGRIRYEPWEAEFYRLALKQSGAIQAQRWTRTAGGLGFVPSFNGPHSLFVDTIRSMRVLALGHQLGHILMGEQDQRISLLRRLILHATATARYNVFYGEGRDAYDLRGRSLHEAVFNVTNGVYRCPNTQQGYSPFSTWTRGLSWVVSGFAEELEWLASRPEEEFGFASGPAGGPASGPAGGPAGGTETGASPQPAPSRDQVEATFLRAACAAADFFIAHTPTDGIPYWDTGAPGLRELGDYMDRPADPFNQHEPVDSSAAAITAQGLWRLGRYLDHHAERLSLRELDLDGLGPTRYAPELICERARDYRCAAVVCANTLFDEPYLSSAADHQGILLHTVYHRPNGWDYVPPGSAAPHGESCMWGDYHLLELAVMLKRENEGGRAQRFYDIGEAEGTS